MGVSRDGDRSPRLTVKTVYGAKHKRSAKVTVAKGVGQGVLPVSVGRVGGHPRGLMADHHVLILVKDGQGKRDGRKVWVYRLFSVIYGQGETVALF